MQSDILSYGPSYNHKPTITVKSIFSDNNDNNNWDAFQLSEKFNLRDVEIKEVTKMMTCKDANRGFFTYFCDNCGTVTTVHFGCNSRICKNCGKNRTDKWAKSLSKALFNVTHRHAVLTISDALWSVVRENRFLLKVLMDAAINDTISSKYRNRRLVAGAVVVLHPFSKNMAVSSTYKIQSRISK